MRKAFYAALLILGSGHPLAAPVFTLSSTDIKPGVSVPAPSVYDEAGCSGGNLSPELDWSGAPVGTRSFAVTVFDPDEKVTGSGWWHWVVYNLPGASNHLA